MKGAQLGATEAALNWLGYIIHHAPGLALLVMPSLDMARRNTRTRLDPMIEATPVLRDAIAAPRSRDAYNSAFTKSFPGGMLVMTGANSAAALRSTPARYLALDEVDGFPPDCGGEGDPVALAIARTVTFAGRRKILLTSTPTVAGVSRIEKEGGHRTQKELVHAQD
jgi:phage terminase large subunit GpA-like protein